MIVKILGSAAGGGLPQWNCSCANCKRARAGQIPSRTQSSLAFSADGEHWFLINASPDIRLQLQMLPLAERGERASPVEGILLNNADIDHVLGLLILREGHPIPTYTSPSIGSSLSIDLHLKAILKNYCGLHVFAAPTDWAYLHTSKGVPTGLRFKAFPIGGSSPRYAPAKSAGTDHALAFCVEHLNGEKLVCALDLPALTHTLLEELANADLAILDGTFWSEGEMIQHGFSERTASQMGHLPIGGEGGSLQGLARQSAEPRTLVFSHINNTNPILDPESKERAEVLSSGAVIAEDGMEWKL